MSAAGSRARWMRRAVVAGQPQGVRGDGGDRPGQAEEACGPLDRHDLAHLLERGVDVGLGRRHLRGRRRVVVQVPLGQPHAADVDRPGRRDRPWCPGRPRWSLRRCRRRGTGPAPGQAAGGAVEGQGRLLLAGDDLGRDAEDVLHHRRRTPTGSRRRGWPRSPPCARGPHRARARARRSRSSAVPVRLSAARPSRPVRSTPSPSRTTRISRCRSCLRVPSTSATSRRIELVPQSTTATLVTGDSSVQLLAGHGVGVVRVDARAGLPPVGQRRERLVAERVDARPDGEAVRHEDVQALDPHRHAALCRNPLEHLVGVAPGHVVVGGGLVAGPQLRVGVEALGHLPHQALGLQRADPRGELGAGEVVEGGEGRAVGQPRGGLHDVGQGARAAVGHRGHGPRGAAQLQLDGAAVPVRGGHRAASAACRLLHSCPYQGAPARAARCRAAASGAGASGRSTTYAVSPGITKCSRSRATCRT